jgi:hypothetical protein
VRSSRLTALVILGGVIAGGLVLDAAEDPKSQPEPETVVAGVAMPAAAPAGSLSSTWYCAGGTATDDGFADHVLLIANPTDRPRRATITVLTGSVLPEAPEPPAEGETTTTTTAPTEPTTTTTVPAAAEPTVVDLPARTRIEVALRDLADAPIASAIIEVEGGEIAVDHQVTDSREGQGGGRATAPCSSTAARQWSFPWGVTARGAQELLVFMNPFPDDATVDVLLATDEGTREPQRLQNLVVRARSSLGVFIDADTRRDHVSAHVLVSRGRLVVDRIETFDGTDPALEGITLGLGAPTPAAVWMFPDGMVREGITEQVVVFNTSDEVAEVDVEVRLDDPEVNLVPEPFELTIAPNRFSIVNLHEPDPEVSEDVPARIPLDVGHTILVRSLNHVAVTAERVVTRSEPLTTVGVSATLGAPLAAPTWFLPGGGVTEQRDERVAIFNASADETATVDVTGFADGETIVLQGLQGLEIPAGGRRTIRVNDALEDQEVLSLMIEADGPIVVERALYRIDGRGSSLSMGIPLAVDVFVPDPIDG